MTTQEATEAGYWQLTNEYHLPQERAALERVLSDFRGSGVNVRLVGDKYAPCVWRDGRIYNETTEKSRSSRMGVLEGRASS
jgi:hypothetical protein